jgi:hypothetical protein
MESILGCWRLNMQCTMILFVDKIAVITHTHTHMYPGNIIRMFQSDVWRKKSKYLFPIAIFSF